MSDTSDPGPAGAGPGPVDWEFAKQAGARIVPAGPKVSADEAAGVVASIHRAAARAQQPVAETARLHAPGEAPAPLVVDRPTWIGLNADSMSAMVDPVFAQIVGRRKQQPSAAVAAVGGKVTGGEAGALLAFMASKVLGQYDLAPGGTPRLLLVAPNVVHVERELGVDPDDFRLWVCMHEETHRVQFTAVPWLREHMIERARSLASEMAPDPDKLQDVLSRLSRQLPEAFKSGGTGITELIATPEQRERLAQMTAVMSLLEGHADVVMDEVGPQVIPSVAEIRAKFNERRKGVGAFDRLLRRLLGLEAKMRQYRDGAVFVRSVIDEVGVDGFNRVWTSPETLPLPREIEEPSAWVARVHG
ncbi:zinc-dependent metalloprotease [Knoellia sp. 3-2P3]|uniref:zinc-dependent metalloprotease n=1 Tax=unclassified Knoellia TaxID=2618719 RepID=UPI0023D9B6C7|nr:zinc-dependent metalloprotease [Knoellia sp. 3-2P3]MDF2090819.1 zinc-dependent metalloprotease [Knoellia sp. 3-2P3]